ncbi:hypothetical protein DYQ86_22090 [Acidobacteria bacterium AB60]|nr:hypothetical protein DYQ86_22090 [Acidobacteria bacterium AB60]
MNSLTSGLSYGRDPNLSGASEGAVPAVGSRIRIEARDGVFVVLRTDLERGTVDVLQISGQRQIEGGIALNSVRVVTPALWMDLSSGFEV